MLDSSVMRLIAACVAASMICTVLRVRHPELATTTSLATGVAVLAALARAIATQAPELEALGALFRRADARAGAAVLRAAGIAIAAELGAQLCADAGETALAGRIELASRVATLGLCLPLAADIARSLGLLLS